MGDLISEMECEEVYPGDTNPTEFKLRGRQGEWVQAVEKDEAAGIRRLLVVAPGGVGKGSVMSYLANKKWRERGIRTLITQNREHLVHQIAERARSITGLEVGVEMGGEFASPHAAIVCASAQTLGRVNRLTAFSDSHFGLVIPDECHVNSLSPQASRILKYFHFGAESLMDGWSTPERYIPMSTVVGFTASPDLGGRRNLGEFFQKKSVDYSYLDAIEEGWLVGLREINIPVKVDTRKFRRTKNSEGDAFNAADQAAAIAPIIRELAEQIVKYAFNRKTIAFLPSVETSRIMADTLNAMGMTAYFVSGECLDKGEKTDLYNSSGPGTVLCNCALVTYGIDFVDTDCIAIFSAVISKCNYVQKLFRATRVLPGIVSDEMSAEERRAAIARSAKPYSIVLSPFFVSDRIDICEPFDLFNAPVEGRKKIKMGGDFTDTGRIRDGLRSLEKAADKHRHKQPRTIDPVIFSLSVGDDKIMAAASDGDTEATKEEKDILLEAGIDTTKITTSTQAQRLIATIRERDRLGLATPKMVTQLRLSLGYPEEEANAMKKGRAGVIIGGRIRYSPKPNRPAIPVQTG